MSAGELRAVRFVDPGELGENVATLVGGVLRIDRGAPAAAVAWVLRDVAPVLETGRPDHARHVRHLRVLPPAGDELADRARLAVVR